MSKIDYAVLTDNITSNLLPLLNGFMNSSSVNDTDLIDRTKSLLMIASQLSTELDGVFWTCVAVVIILGLFIIGGSYLARRMR